jgi:hypothetical protein
METPRKRREKKIRARKRTSQIRDRGPREGGREGGKEGRREGKEKGR